MFVFLEKFFAEFGEMGKVCEDFVNIINGGENHLQNAEIYGKIDTAVKHFSQKPV